MTLTVGLSKATKTKHIIVCLIIAWPHDGLLYV